MYPAKIQLRGFESEEISKLFKKAKEIKAEIVHTKDGVDVFFDDVEKARRFISKLKKDFNFEIKMSTENLGFKKGRGKYLFVYSLRKS